MLNRRAFLLTSVVLAFAAAILSACGDGDSTAETSAANGRPGVVVVEPAEAMAVIEEGDPDLVVLDVRTPEEFAEAHIADAILIDIYEPDFADRIAELDRSVPYVLYCRSGNRSEEARNLMDELGFEEVYDVAGGIVGWAEAGLPVVT
jgi:rhodanese-related sulfurtransferase